MQVSQIDCTKSISVFFLVLPFEIAGSEQIQIALIGSFAKCSRKVCPVKTMEGTKNKIICVTVGHFPAMSK
jgi:hypothetical protein